MKMKLICGIGLCLLVTSLAAFEVKTRIYPADCDATVRIKAVSDWAQEWLAIAVKMQKEGKDQFQKGKEWPLVGYYREDRRYSDGETHITSSYPEPLSFKIEGNEIVVNVKLRNEAIHAIVFAKLPAAAKRFRDFRYVKLMTLDQDSFQFRPFKGNVHQHSKISDGKWDPQDHVGYARIAGFDFIGVSDHYKYEQNASVIQAAADFKSGLTVYPAEEMHTPGAVLHSLSIGGKGQYSVRKRTPEWNETVRPVLEEVKKQFPKLRENELTPWAESLVLARRAKADGALVVYCHPAWRPRYYINNTFRMIDFIIRSREFDAIEIINGGMTNRSRRDNLDAWAVFHEICVETGTKIPVISSSDSHDVSRDSYRRTYTLIFAPDCTFSSFRDAVINGRAVASYDLDEETPQPIHLGRAKYVRYANFLDETGYWKTHDELAKKQGELIQKFQKGEKDLLPEIAKLAEEIEQYRKDFFYQAK